MVGCDEATRKARERRPSEAARRFRLSYRPLGNDKKRQHTRPGERTADRETKNKGRIEQSQVVQRHSAEEAGRDSSMAHRLGRQRGPRNTLYQRREGFSVRPTRTPRGT